MDYLAWGDRLTTVNGEIGGLSRSWLFQSQISRSFLFINLLHAPGRHVFLLQDSFDHF